MFQMPIVTRNLLIINTLCFIACVIYGTDASGVYLLNDVLGLHFFKAADFHFYQLFTYMFVHANFQHILFNMFALWMFGCVVERVLGTKKFILYYIICGLGAGLFQEAAQYVAISMDLADQGLAFSMVDPKVFNGFTTVGASGAIYGVLLAFGMLFPNERIFIIPIPIPIKAKWLIAGYVAIELFSALTTPGDSVAHVAHLGGMVIGFFLIRYWVKHPSAGFGVGGRAAAFGKLKGMFGGQDHAAAPGSGRWGRHRGQSAAPTPADRQSDWDYNARKQANQKEIDRILDKIRKSGYDSLSKEEKQKLFDQSK